MQSFEEQVYRESGLRHKERCQSNGFTTTQYNFPYFLNGKNSVLRRAVHFFPDIFCTFSPASTANDWNVQVFGIFDVEQLVHHLKLQGQLSGLKRLRLVDVVNYLFDAALPVSKSVTMSNWEVCPFLLQPSFQKLNLSILLLEEKARKNAEHK